MTPPPKPPAPPRPADPAKVVRVTSTQLFGGAGEILIEHFGVAYRLRQTALGKLILTK